MEKKDARKEKIDAQMKQIGVQLNKLVDTADKVADKIKAEYQKQIKNLQVKGEAVGKKFEEMKKSSAPTFEDIKAAAGKSLEALKKTLDSTASNISKAIDKKDVYIKQMEDQFKQLDAQIDKLAVLAGKATDDVKKEYFKQIEVLKAKEKIVKSKLQDIKKSSTLAWQDIKAGTEAAGKELKKTLDQVIARFK